jgi:pimeloyl-ACP methyl ester carboxylesterase
LNFSDQYPFSGKHHITQYGYNMHYLDEGPKDGPVVVFLHGNPTWSFMYRNVIKELKSTHRCIAPDHIGCGLSEKPHAEDFPYDLKSHSENIRGLLDHLQIKQFSLVVHDWGGAIGLTAFRDQLDRVEKLSLLNTAAFNDEDVPKRILFCRLPLVGSLFVRGLNGFAWPATFMATVKGLSAEVKRGLLAPYDSWRNRVAVWRFVKDIPYEADHPTRSLLKETESMIKNLAKTPILSCWGMKDFCFHPGYLKQWKKHLPHIDSHEFNDAGHYIIEDKCDECVALLSSFLRK